MNPQLTPKNSMDSKSLYHSINLKNGNQVNTLLANIELHRKSINLYAEMAEEAKRRHDYKTVNDIKSNKLPLVLDALNKVKESLLKTIALSAFEVIDKL